jgi:murein DD-endopeptidase MepM/ murein hydrolase activator NlpD
MSIPYPLLGVELNKASSASLDLSRDRLSELNINPDNHVALGDYIYTDKYRYGGYGEQRSIYDSSGLFSADSEPRDIHLGIDLWAESGHSIYAPWDGVIVSALDNAQKGDYGPTLILKHRLDGQLIYSLYGHLSRESLRYSKGDQIQQGMLLTEIGNTEVNGGWLPHLHFQLMYDLEAHLGDYPGVCRSSEWESYQRNCPNPASFGLCP